MAGPAVRLCARRLSRLIFSTVRGGFVAYPLRLFRPRDPFPAAPSGVPAWTAVSTRGPARDASRGAVTGAGTFLGGVVHMLPFLVPRYRPTVLPELTVIASELPGLAWTGRRFCGTGLLTSFVSVTLGGAISVSLGTVR
jgi:hypothetical protein